MTHRPVNPETVAKPASAYAQAMRVADGTRLIVSCQIGIAPDGMIPESYEAQARQAWANLFAILADQGFSVSDLVKIVVYDVMPGDVATYRAVRDEMLGGHLVASTYVRVSGLASDSLLTEIEAEAVKP